MIEIVDNFVNYTDNLKTYIKNSNYKMIHFVKKLNISETTFYRKIKENSFTVKEVVILTKILFPEEYYKNEFKKSILQSDKDYKNGNVADAKTHLKEMREKYL